MISTKGFRIPSAFEKIHLRRIIQNCLDIWVLISAFVFAYLLRFDFWLPDYLSKIMLIQLAFLLPYQLLILRVFNVHKFIWRYVSIQEFTRIFTALGIASLPLLLLRFSLPGHFYYGLIPISIIVMNYLLGALGIMAIRLLRRKLHDATSFSEFTNNNGSRRRSALLVGAGRAGLLTLVEIKKRGDIDFDVKGFVDDDTQKHGAIINGVRVLGTTGSLPDLVERLEIETVIITIAHATREEFQRILNICRSIPVEVRTIPTLYELLQNKVSVSRIRKIEIDDLLGRSPIQLDKKSVEQFLRNKVIMVSGAGGSIGSELIRQLCLCEPAKLLLIERSEFALFEIEREIKEIYPNICCKALIADVCDVNRMSSIFERHRPDVVFHAAAHKHVPMMEANASEAIKNNILGTNTIGRLAGKFGAESFVLISTDKAVNPTSVMGATKRAAELVVQDLERKYATRYVAVRFGNVIGSNGSVIPIFQEQIKNGGPVTVTHPDMERFFMTIPEASQLVLQAGAIGAGGEIFVLDMGKPVKILDLAKETIRLSGLKPEIDIEIVFTGIRPGEKLYEELQSENEKLPKTTHPKILVGMIESYSSPRISEMLKTAQILSETDDNDKIRRFMNEFLPEANLDRPKDVLPVEIKLDGDNRIVDGRNILARVGG